MFVSMSLFVPTKVANAATSADRIAELQATIASLLEQVAKVQAELKRIREEKPTDCSYTWNRNLRIGDEGEDVRQLQQYLNGQGLSIAESGPGSPGLESDFFGKKTAMAMASFQERYRSEILTPNGLTQGSWFFGPSTRAKIHSLCTDTPDPDDEEEVKISITKDGLTVKAKIRVTGSSCESGASSATFGSIDWDDGDDYRVSGKCSNGSYSETLSHDYEEEDRYKIEFVTDGGASDSERVTVEEESAGLTCSDGRADYKEGEKTDTIYNDDGTVTGLYDAYYVCRSGEWKTEGMMDPTAGECPQIYAPVCGVFSPTSISSDGVGSAALCADGIDADGNGFGYCSNDEKTFGSMCELNNAISGFQLLHSGECKVEETTQCSVDLAKAGEYVEGLICGQGGSQLTCPHDSSVKIWASNTCSEGYLVNERGWESIPEIIDYEPEDWE